jgi:MFS transporter, DHA2 family, methylenomycin A resistance protein
LALSTLPADRPSSPLDAVNWATVGVVCLGYTMAGWAMGPVASILPTISSSLDISVAAAGWIMNIYFLMLVGTLLVMGRLGDIVGHGRIFGIGSAVLASTMLLCGLSSGFELLLVARGLQGIGSAMVFGTSLAIVAAAVPSQSRGQAIGVLTMTQGLASLLGVWVSTWSVQYLEWHWAFIIPAPLGLLGAWLGLRLRLPRVEIASRKLDWMGAIVLFATLTAAVFLVGHTHEVGETFEASLPYHAGLFAVTVALLVAFLKIERAAEAPLLGFKLLSDSRFSSGVLGNGIAHMSMLATGFLLPFLLERGRGMTPAETGPLVMGQQVAMIGTSLLFGYLYDRFRSPFFGAAMLASLGGGLLTLSVFGGSWPYLALVGLGCLLGMGLGGFSTVNNTAVMGLAPRDQRGFASGLVETTRQFGHALGVSISSGFIAGALATSASPGPADYIAGFEQASRAMGLVAMLGVVALLWPTLRQRFVGPSRPDLARQERRTRAATSPLSGGR